MVFAIGTPAVCLAMLYRYILFNFHYKSHNYYYVLIIHVNQDICLKDESNMDL